MTKVIINDPILVLGGTGKTGSRIIKGLNDMGVPTRIGSRGASPSFDWADKKTWKPALEGTSAVYISYYPDLAVSGAVEDIKAFSELALSMGIDRLVLLSGRGEEEAQLAEKVIQQSGAKWTILRASWFAQNFSESFLLDSVVGGTIVLPVGDVGEPFIDVEDIAEVAVKALTEAGHEGQLYELTGPRLLSFSQAVQEISEINGKELQYIEVSAESYAKGMEEMGLPKAESDLVMYLFTTILDGRNSNVTDGVQRALGRYPRDFREYAKTASSTGVWEAA